MIVRRAASAPHRYLIWPPRCTSGHAKLGPRTCGLSFAGTMRRATAVAGPIGLMPASGSAPRGQAEAETTGEPAAPPTRSASAASAKTATSLAIPRVSLLSRTPAEKPPASPARGRDKAGGVLGYDEAARR